MIRLSLILGVGASALVVVSCSSPEENPFAAPEGSGGGAQTASASVGASGGGGETAAECGDGIVQAGEECDDVDLGHADCSTLGFSAPEGLGCSAACTFDTGKCASTCGDGSAEPSEACDGDDLLGKSCVDFGYDKAEGLGCDAACEVDTTTCKPTCDGVRAEPQEGCDGADLAGQTCADFGYSEPAGLSCEGCNLDLSGCVATCGDGVREPSEECDGADGVASGESCTANCKTKPPGVISEIYYDPNLGAADTGCFIELKGDPNLSLDGYSLVFINGANGNEYAFPIDLTGQAFGDSGYFVVIQDVTVTVAPGAAGLVDVRADLQDGPDNLLLMKGTKVVDAVGYGSFGASQFFVGEGTPAAGTNASLSRDVSGKDTEDNAADFHSASIPTPGTDNQ